MVLDNLENVNAISNLRALIAVIEWFYTNWEI